MSSDQPEYLGIAPLMGAGPAMSAAEYAQWRDEHTWAPPPGSRLVIEDDLEPAAWIEPLLVPWSSRVYGIVPRLFEAYARVFFPFPGDDIVADGEVIGQERITWTELACRNGRTAHALMEAETIMAGPDDYECSSPGLGGLADEQFEALLPILARHTSSPAGWFLLWEGFGDLNEQAFGRNAPRLTHPARNYYLLHGPHQSYASFSHNPNYWWPEDQAWCVVTDTDLDWAYVAGTEACIEEILAEPAIEAYPTRAENPAHSRMDVLNDPGGIIPRRP